MSDKYITSKGKGLLLQLGFLSNNSTSNFNYLALGSQNSSGSQGEAGTFQEISDSTYRREQLHYEDSTDSSLSVSAIFDDTNYQPAEGGIVSEIGIVNQYEKNSSTDQWFAFLKVPDIKKDGNISLKYTIVISIE
ncbi:MAG: hypothetical protein IKF82_00035 [Bacilli bacterium]|nr:hypothetical protein [Bacilli bacterium]